MTEFVAALAGVITASLTSDWTLLLGPEVVIAGTSAWYRWQILEEKDVLDVSEDLLIGGLAFVLAALLLISQRTGAYLGPEQSSIPTLLVELLISSWVLLGLFLLLFLGAVILRKQFEEKPPIMRLVIPNIVSAIALMTGCLIYLAVEELTRGLAV